MSVLVGIPVLIIRRGDADADIYINHRGFSLATRAVRGGAIGRKMPDRQRRHHVIFIRWTARSTMD